jgi:restriction endonuclease S subunit
LKIPLPPLFVQQEIVEEIEGYQKIIDGARQVVENYKPVIKIDPEWEMVELGEIAKPEYGFTDNAKDNGNSRYIRITDIDSNGIIKEDDGKYIDCNENNEKYILNENDLIVARTGATFGKTAIFRNQQKSIFASFLIRLNIDEKCIDPYFYWAFSQTDEYWKQANSLVSGGAQPQFNANAIKKIRIPKPPINIQKDIVKNIEEEQELIKSNNRIIEIYEQKIKDKIAEVWGE